MVVADAMLRVVVTAKATAEACAFEFSPPELSGERSAQVTFAKTGFYVVRVPTLRNISEALGDSL